jgi:hypothetical protein
MDNHKSKDNFGNIIINFGIHKGKMICDIPSDYLQWLSEECYDDMIAEAADKEWQFREKWKTHFNSEHEKSIAKANEAAKPKELKAKKTEDAIIKINNICKKGIDDSTSQIQTIERALSKGKIDSITANKKVAKYSGMLRVYNEILLISQEKK